MTVISIMSPDKFNLP